jgi:hypothetical protein
MQAVCVGIRQLRVQSSARENAKRRSSMLRRTISVLFVSTAVGLAATAVASAQDQQKRNQAQPAQPAQPSATGIDTFHNMTPPVKSEDENARARTTSGESSGSIRSERRRGREVAGTRREREEGRVSAREERRVGERGEGRMRERAGAQASAGYVRSNASSGAYGATSNGPNYSYNSYNSGGWNSWNYNQPTYTVTNSSYGYGYNDRCYAPARVLINGIWEPRRVWVCG